jgi:tetratricopeptide (TPR) repeat protein
MDTITDIELNYRYPGSRSFYDTEIDQNLFFGREREIEVLLDKVLTSNVVVLYSKSGLGKTSLINAGLSKALRKKILIPLTIRFNNREFNPLQAVYDGIKEIVKQKNLDYEPGDENSLWEYFKTVSFWKKETLLKPVLIIDQFEEFFTLHPFEDRSYFTQQLADVVKNTIPKVLRESVSLGKTFPYSETPPNVKIIISIREDYLGQLEEMERIIPGIYHNKFRLLPLTRENAKQAIINPCQVKYEMIHSAPFKFAQETVDMMLNFLCTRKEMGEIKITDEVESFQLQLLCQHIEHKVREKVEKGKADIIVEPQDLEGEAGMQRVLRQFYNMQIKKLDTFWKKRRIRKLCEKGLISVDDRRLSLEVKQIKRKFKVTKELLTELVNSRLLRSEPRVGSIYYELSHDTLVAPIRESQKKHRTKKIKIKFGIFMVLILIASVFFIKYLDHISRKIKINEFYEEAGELKTNRSYERAAERYNAILEIDKKFVKAYLEMGQIYYAKGEYYKAIRIYNKAIDNKVKHALIYYQLGQTFWELGKMEEAAKNYKESLKIDPNLFKAFENLGEIYENRKEFEKAIKSYQQSLKIDKKRPEIYRKLAISYIKNDEPEKAIDAYKQALNMNVEYAEIYEEISDSLKEKGKWKCIEKIYELASESGSKKASLYFNLGNDYYELEMHDHAINNYKKAIEIDPKNAFGYLFWGAALNEQGRYSEAIEVNPKYAVAYVKMGDTLSNLKKYAEAIEAYREATKVEPKFEKAYRKIAETMAIEQQNKKIDDKREAIPSSKKETLQMPLKSKEMEAIKNHFEKENYEIPPDSLGVAEYERRPINIDEKFIMKFQKSIELKDKANIYYRRGIGLLKKRKYNKAIKSFQRAIDLSPDNTDLYYNIGNAFYMHKIYDEAIELFEEVIRIDPEYYYAYIGLGIVLFAKKDYNSAIEKFEKAINLNPKNTIAYFNKGVLFYYQKRYKEAIEAFEMSIGLDPTNIIAKANLAESYLIVEHFEKSFSLANQLLKEKIILVDRTLALRFVSISSLIFQEQLQEACIQLKTLIEDYKSIPGDYERTWDYIGVKEFISKNKKLSQEKTQLLLQLIDILESPKAGGYKKIKELEKSIPEIIK